MEIEHKTKAYGLLIISIDEIDIPLYNSRTWTATKADNTIYFHWGASKNGKVMLHRLIIGANKGELVDHKDGNGLNLTRSNLRIATHQQNMCNRKIPINNTTGFKGVAYIPFGKRKKRYYTALQFNRKTIPIGYFMTAEEASKAYNEKAKQVFGEFYRETA